MIVVSVGQIAKEEASSTYPDLRVERHLFLVVLLIVIRIHAQVMESELLLYPLLESQALLEGQAIRLGNDRNNIDDIAQLLQNDNVNRLESVTRRLDEIQAAVDPRVLDVALALGGELLVQVGAVLVLDILDDRVPAAIVVDQIAIAGGVDNVETETDTVFLDHLGRGLDLGGAADGLVGRYAALGVEKVRGEDGVDESGFAETGLACEDISRMGSFNFGGDIEFGWHTNTDDIELKTALQKLPLDLVGNAVETDVALGKDGLPCGGHCHGGHDASVSMCNMRARS